MAAVVAGQQPQLTAAQQQQQQQQAAQTQAVMNEMDTYTRRLQTQPKRLFAPLEVRRFLQLGTFLHAVKRQRGGAGKQPVKGTLRQRLHEFRMAKKRNQPQAVQQGVAVILNDFKPMLTINLYANNFTLDNQASYPYSAFMRTMLAQIDRQVIPKEMLGIIDDQVGPTGQLQQPLPLSGDHRAPPTAEKPILDGSVVVHVRNFRTQPPEERKVILRPSYESLVNDLMIMAMGSSLSTEDIIEVERRVLVATTPPLCLDPSPNVAIVANTIQYNHHKFDQVNKKRRMTDKEVIDWVERNRHNNLDNYVFDPKLKRAGTQVNKEFTPRFPMLSFIDQRLSEDLPLPMETLSQRQHKQAYGDSVLLRGLTGYHQARRPSMFSPSINMPTATSTMSPAVSALNTRSIQIRQIRLERRPVVPQGQRPLAGSQVIVTIEIVRFDRAVPFLGLCETRIRMAGIVDNGQSGDMFKCYHDSDLFAHVHAYNLIQTLTSLEKFRLTNDTISPADGTRVRSFMQTLPQNPMSQPQQMAQMPQQQQPGPGPQQQPPQMHPQQLGMDHQQLQQPKHPQQGVRPQVVVAGGGGGGAPGGRPQQVVRRPTPQGGMPYVQQGPGGQIPQQHPSQPMPPQQQQQPRPQAGTHPQMRMRPMNMMQPGQQQQQPHPGQQPQQQLARPPGGHPQQQQQRQQTPPQQQRPGMQMQQQPGQQHPQSGISVGMTGINPAAINGGSPSSVRPVIIGATTTRASSTRLPGQPATIADQRARQLAQQQLHQQFHPQHPAQMR